MTNKTENYYGIGFSGALTILFIAFKLTSIINWSWWWVLSPIWISIGIWFVILFFAFVIMLIIRT